MWQVVVVTMLYRSVASIKIIILKRINGQFRIMGLEIQSQQNVSYIQNSYNAMTADNI